MADEIVVELGYTAADLDQLARTLERLATQRRDKMAFDTLVSLEAVVPEHLPAYVRDAVRRLEVEDATYGDRFWNDSRI